MKFIQGAIFVINNSFDITLTHSTLYSFFARILRSKTDCRCTVGPFLVVNFICVKAREGVPICVLILAHIHLGLIQQDSLNRTIDCDLLLHEDRKRRCLGSP